MTSKKLVTETLESSWQAFFFSVVSKIYTDKLFACQPFIKLLTDKQIPCQAYQNIKKVHALTRKTLVKIKKTVTSFLLVSGVEKLHWQAFCLSTNHKNINWQAKYLSGLPKSKEYSCSDKKNTCQKSKKVKVTGWTFLLLTSISLVSDIEK